MARAASPRTLRGGRPAISLVVARGAVRERARAPRSSRASLARVRARAQMADAIACLHEKNIIHRDLKTANCFLAEDGSVKIGDLNVSKRMKNGLLRTQIGTPYYMSPEICDNKPYNDRSDVWSMGCLLYEMASLRCPFDARDMRGLVIKILRGVCVITSLSKRCGGRGRQRSSPRDEAALAPTRHLTLPTAYARTVLLNCQ